jgi:hypothetical protein
MSNATTFGQKITVYVCGNVTPTQKSFFFLMHNIRLQLWSNGYPHIFMNKHMGCKRLPYVPDRTRYALRVSRMNWYFDFVWSPGTTTTQESAENNHLGIHQIWFNYNTMMPVMTNNITEQLQTGTSRIQQIQLHVLPPHYKEYDAIQDLEFLISEYYQCGWNFTNKLTVLPPPP